MNSTPSPIILDSPTVFIADVHLGASPEADQRFNRFMTRLPPEMTIVSLGDLVETWAEGPGYDLGDQYPEFRLFQGRQCFFLPGNRDFLMGSRWEALTGGRVLGDSAEFRIAGRRILGLHGDTLLAGDRRYQLWRQVCRSRLFRLLAAQAGEQVALKAAQGLRQGSRAEVARKPAASMAIDLDLALAELGNREALICGHVHRRARRPLGRGELLVLGEWTADAEVALVDQAGIHFKPAEAVGT